MLRRLQRILCAAMIAVLLLSAATPAMAKSMTAKVSSSSAKVYKKASSASASVKLSKGTKVTVTAVKGSWARVKLNGKTGYMPKKYLTAASGSGSETKVQKTAAYVSKKTYVYRSASSSASRRSVSPNTKVYVVGRSGSYCKVQNASGSATGYVKTSCLSRRKVSSGSGSLQKKSGSSWRSRVVKLDWFSEGKYVLKKGGYGYIYDIDTGIALRIKRMGGHYHADVEPASAADTSKLLRVARGRFSWKSHAVILKAGGKYVASAINTLPHGDQTIRNNGYDGQFCLHTSGSWTHASSKENASHQAAIDRAYRWAHR